MNMLIMFKIGVRPMILFILFGDSIWQNYYYHPKLSDFQTVI